MNAKRIARAIATITLLTAVPAIHAQEQEFPKMPAPQKEHEWLKQFVGRWDVKSEAIMAPGAPPMKCEGTETARMLGGFWLVSQLESEMMGQPMSAMLTIGYDAEKKNYVGTWIDSATSHLWHYTGAVDESGKIITLEAEGPNMLVPGKTAKYRDVTEFKSKDHKVLTSSILGDDGKWVTFMTANYHRKK